MASLHNDVYDNGLSTLTSNGNRLDLCSTEPTTYTQATSTYTLGNKTSPTISAPGNRSGGGRKVTVSAITDGTVTGTGTAAYYAVVDTVNSKLLAAGQLGASQAVTSGNTFSLTALDIGIPAPA